MRGGRSRSARFRVIRSVASVAGLLLVSALLQPGPAAVAGPNQTNQVKWGAPSPIPDVLPDALREEVPADIQQQGDPDPPVADFTLDSDPTKILQGLTEDLAARSDVGNVFKTAAGGDHLLQVFAEPVNFEDDSGDWVPIDTDLVSDGNGGLKNKANAFSTDFPDQLSSTTPAQVHLDQGTFTFSVDGASPVEQVKDDKDSLSYAGVLPGVDLSYDTRAMGFDEAITLADSGAAKSPVAFDLSSTDLTFRQEKTGEVSILSADAVVGVLPAPVAFDSSKDPNTGEPAFGGATQTLTDLGGGSWRLEASVDPAFVDVATFPIVIDPGTLTLNPGRDTWVDEANPNSSYETGSNSDELRAGNAVTNYTRYGFVNFYVGNYDRSKRIVITAQMSLWPTFVANSSVNVNVKAPTASWPAQGSFTWNTMPAAGSTLWAAHHGGPGNWYSFDLTGLYQNILDTDIGWTNYGLRLSGDGASPVTDNYHRFASSKTGITGAQPQLYVYFNDPPAAPTLDYPADAAVVTYSSPSLHVVPPSATSTVTTSRSTTRSPPPPPTSPRRWPSRGGWTPSRRGRSRRGSSRTDRPTTGGPSPGMCAGPGTTTCAQ